MEKLIKEIRENENLNNLEVFKSDYWSWSENGETILALDYSEVPDSPREPLDDFEFGALWFYWFCMPGCLPDSAPFGPFTTENDALENALEMFG